MRGFMNRTEAGRELAAVLDAFKGRRASSFWPCHGAAFPPNVP
jgi:hypothetical protein